ncbi:hypothetical protein N8I71_03820 [Roseibacterium sp. SDUM158016]|uniref:hypothetical protein n=1 Tax=Roseicyclus sediminis TaxID=2980997 RepID=UPI0021CEDEC2|nr:hypothetical protein [Roseibacterium sp. SDUM158016]MCU4651942.1 hypothetical protein [Roseibacterium sp. SDUM158016]
MRGAALISLAVLALPLPASAQAIACAFTLVCAPEIECEPHEGIPFEIGYSEGTHWIEVDGVEVAGVPVTEDPLSLVFAAGEETLLFTLSDDGEGALTRHVAQSGARLAVATFVGRCVTA